MVSANFSVAAICVALRRGQCTSGHGSTGGTCPPASTARSRAGFQVAWQCLALRPLPEAIAMVLQRRGARSVAALALTSGPTRPAGPVPYLSPPLVEGQRMERSANSPSPSMVRRTLAARAMVTISRGVTQRVVGAIAIARLVEEERMERSARSPSLSTARPTISARAMVTISRGVTQWMGVGAIACARLPLGTIHTVCEREP